MFRFPRRRRPHHHLQLHRCFRRPAAVDIAVWWGRGAELGGGGGGQKSFYL